MRRRLQALARAWQLAVCAVTVLRQHDAASLAAAVAYYSLLSVFPLVLLAGSLAASLLDQAEVYAGLRTALHTYLPPDAAAVVQQAMAESVRVRRPAGVAALLVFLWSGSTATGAARHALNRVLGIAAGRPVWRRKLVDLAATLWLGALLAASLSLALARELLVRAAPWIGPHTSRLSSGLDALGRLGPPLLTFLAFLSTYGILPAHRQPPRGLLAGAVLAATLFELARGLAFRTLEIFPRYQLVYGSLAGVIVFMVWVYAAALILLLGAAVMRCSAGSVR